MPKLCLYFHLHQPFRLKDVNVFDVGEKSNLFVTSPTDNQNERIFNKVAEKSYRPMLSLLLELTKKVPSLKFALSISGVFLEQAEQFAPDITTLLQKLVRTGKVELLAETYYHSLASLYSDTEFKNQVHEHTQLLQKLFNYTPTVFRNTELIYSNDVAKKVAKLGFSGMLTEAVPRYLGDRPKTSLYKSFSKHPIPLMLKHAELSDDIAFRFSNRNWPSYPLYADTYLDWLSDYSAEEYVNLFMDFETFGEHQWEAEGIFEFFSEVVHDFAKGKWNSFVTPSEVFAGFKESTYGENNLSLIEDEELEGSIHVSRLSCADRDNRAESKEKRVKTQDLASHQAEEKRFSLNSLPVYDVPEPISWADIDRDLTAWVDNDLQRDAIRLTYELEDVILQTKEKDLIRDWRYLQSSDHFYFMCTKWADDGDVHAYFSPYESPYEAYRRFSIALADLQYRLSSVTATTSLDT